MYETCLQNFKPFETVDDDKRHFSGWKMKLCVCTMLLLEVDTIS